MNPIFASGVGVAEGVVEAVGVAVVVLGAVGRLDVWVGREEVSEHRVVESGVRVDQVYIMISCNHPIYLKIIRRFCLFFVPFISSGEA